MSAGHCAECGAPATARCGRCRGAEYCTTACQAAAWPAHKVACTPLVVLGVRITDSIGTATAVALPLGHRVFSCGAPLPVGRVIGVPLLIMRELTVDPFSIPRSADLDCQPATYFMINAGSGFAAPEWQENVGPVVVARADGKPLTVADAGCLWDYFCHLLVQFPDSSRPKLLSQPAFARFVERYNKEQLPEDRASF